MVGWKIVTALQNWIFLYYHWFRKTISKNYIQQNIVIVSQKFL